MGYHGRFEKMSPKPGKSRRKIVAVIILVVLLLIGGAVFWGVRYYNETLGKMNIVTLDKDLYETYVDETHLSDAMNTTAAISDETETTETAETTVPVMKPGDIINILFILFLSYINVSLLFML